METSTENKPTKRPNAFYRAGGALLCWLSYASVSMFESHMLVVLPCDNGIFISGSALAGVSGVTVSSDNFDVLLRQLAGHKPGVPFPFKQGGSWGIVPARYLRLLTQQVHDVVAAWRSIR